MADIDCCFMQENKWFRYRVGAVIVSGEYALFAKSEADDYYYSVGGGVHVGERSEEALLRETYEETGERFEIERPLCLVENFFMGDGSFEGLDCHVIEFYYLMKPTEKKDINVSSVTANGVSEKMYWLPISRLSEYDIRPAIVKKLAISPPESFISYVNDERALQLKPFTE